MPLYTCSKKIPIVFNNVSNYDYHFIIKELAEEFEKKLTCLRETTEKHITIEHSSNRKKNRERKYKAYILHITIFDSARLMASSLIKPCQ